MIKNLRNIFLGVSILLICVSAYGQEVSRDQLKGLDEQVQEIKSDVIAIAVELNQLEEKLIYPSNTQMAVFISLKKGETFRLDAVDVRLEGEPVAHHIYTFKELEALQKGGVQRIYTGNRRSGEIDLQISMIGKTKGGDDLNEARSFKIHKNVGPKIVEISIGAHDIILEEM